MFHARILTGLPRVAFRENDSEQGIFFTLHCSTQPDIQSYMTKEKQQHTLKRSCLKDESHFVGFNDHAFHGSSIQIGIHSSVPNIRK